MSRCFIAFLVFFIDQLSKLFVIKFFPGIVSLNQGISFGLFPSSFWLYINILIIIFFTFYKKDKLGTGLILGGGISNLLDRLIRGGVVDFIDLKIFPVFNLADFFIVLGGILLFFKLFLKK